jgi:hypothetical protein
MAAILVKEFPRKLEKRDKDNYLAKIGGTIFSNASTCKEAMASKDGCNKHIK